MRVLYLDLGMGAAGDMLTAALLELLPDPASFVDELNALGLPGIRYVAQKTTTCGITGTHMSVLVHGAQEGDHPHDHHHGEEDHLHDHHHHHHDGESPIAADLTAGGSAEDHTHGQHGAAAGHGHHHHTSLADIATIVGDLAVAPHVKEDILAVYGLIAQAESKVHGRPTDQVHFHEVGTLDAIADVTAVCLLMDRIHPDEVVASPVHVGSGNVMCAHGLLPVPAPATALILQGIPTYGGDIAGELCTPTGAALVKRFVTRFAPQPGMVVDAIGYGTGTKDFPRANCVRAMLGDATSTDDAALSQAAPSMDGIACMSAPSSPDDATPHAPTPSPDRTPSQEAPGELTDKVIELACNIDDMTAEDLGFAIEALLAAGALDAYAVPIVMKKGRPATMLRVICRPQDRDVMARAVFAHTTTLGVRALTCDRYLLERHMEEQSTPWGLVHVKVAQGFGVNRSKPEFDDLARIARAEGIGIARIRDELERT